MDLTSPGGYVRNSNVEDFADVTSFIGFESQPMNDTNISFFLNLNGWHFHDKNFPVASLNSDVIENLNAYHEVELTKYGKCHVFKDLPEQVTKQGLLLWLIGHYLYVESFLESHFVRESL